jgi:hypothetical protein
MFLHVSLCLQLQLDVPSSFPPWGKSNRSGEHCVVTSVAFNPGAPELCEPSTRQAGLQNGRVRGLSYVPSMPGTEHKKELLVGAFCKNAIDNWVLTKIRSKAQGSQATKLTRGHCILKQNKSNIFRIRYYKNVLILLLSIYTSSITSQGVQLECTIQVQTVNIPTCTRSHSSDLTACWTLK